MTKQTRIGIIRAAIVAQGGDSNVTYYADNTRGMTGNRGKEQKIQDRGDAIYKIDKRTDGLTPDQRLKVVEELNKHPEVKHAYISRQLTDKEVTYSGTTGCHLKVIFYGISGTVVAARTTKRRKHKR